MTYEYIAGFFDGEGSVSSYTQRPKGFAPCPHLSMAQSDPRILQEIKAFLGYGVVWHNRLTIRGRENIIHFADHVGPHLRVKKRRVILAKELALLVGVDNTPRDKSVAARRRELADRIKELNGRRVSWQG